MLERFEQTLTEDDDAINGDEIEVDPQEMENIEGSTLDQPVADDFKEPGEFEKPDELEEIETFAQ
jgi:hypothetical protein